MLQQRNDHSFGYLYDNYSGALLGVVSAIVVDQETARDVLQEVFINIWRKIESYDPTKGRLFTWMMNVARNAAIDKIRSRGYQDSLKWGLVKFAVALVARACRCRTSWL